MGEAFPSERWIFRMVDTEGRILFQEEHLSKFLNLLAIFLESLAPIKGEGIFMDAPPVFPAGSREYLLARKLNMCDDYVSKLIYGITCLK